MSKQESKKKKRYNYQLQRANSTHTVLLVVVGGYVLYMAYRMIENTRTGASEMSMSTTILLAAIMGLLGAGILGYAAFVWYLSRKKAELTEEEARALDEEIARADRENGYIDEDDSNIEAQSDEEDDL